MAGIPVLRRVDDLLSSAVNSTAATRGVGIRECHVTKLIGGFFLSLWRGLGVLLFNEDLRSLESSRPHNILYTQGERLTTEPCTYAALPILDERWNGGGW